MKGWIGAATPCDGSAARQLAVLLALAGCHPASNATGGAPDATMPDGSSPAADAPVQSVTVTVVSTSGDGQPDATAVVIFMDGEQHVVAATTVDAAGQASASVPSGSLVTVLQVGGTATQENDTLTTIRGVKPGDQLHVGELGFPIAGSGDPQIMTTAVSPLAPDNPPVLQTECSNAAYSGPPFTTAQLTFYDNCRPSTFDVFGLQSAANGAYTYLWQPGITYAPGGSFTLDAPWLATGTSQITTTHTPANLLRLAAYLSISVGHLPLQVDMETAELPAEGSNTIALLRTAPSAETRSSIQINEVGGTGPLDERVRFGSAAALAVDTTFDLSSQPLPVPGTVMQSATGATWSLTGAVTGDARVVTWNGGWESIDPTTGDRTNHFVVWYVVEDPMTPTSSQLPGMPSAYAAYDPALAMPGSLDLRGVGVRYVDYDNLDSYDAARAATAGLIYIGSEFPDVDHDVHMTIGASPEL